MCICWGVSGFVDFLLMRNFTNPVYETSYGFVVLIQGLIFTIAEINSGVGTLVSQSFGQKNYKRMCVITLNCLLILM